jgi:hypothetical protein
MTLTFERANYSNLLAEVAPRAIENEAEYDRLLASFTQVIGNAH